MTPLLAHTFRALRHRNFRLFFIGQALSNVGTWLQQVAMGWLTYRLTESALILGVVAFCTNIGVLGLAPFGGVLADRVDRRRALMVTQSMMLLQAVVLTTVVALDVVQVWHLVGLALWLGLAWAFDMPLRQAMYPHLVDDRADLPNAIALNSFTVNAARVIGPAVAGVLVAAFGEAWCFALNAVSYLVVIGAIARLRWPAQLPRGGGAGWWASWLEGARYTFASLPIRILLLIVMVLAWTIGPYSALMPIFARDVYGGGPRTLGLLLTCAGAGALACMIYLAGRSTLSGLPRVLAVAAFTCAIALSAFAYTRTFPLALALMCFIGGGLIMCAAGANVILQTIVDDRLRGRVASFYTMSFMGMTPLGNLAAGALAAHIGAPATLMLNGAVCALVACWFWRSVPKLSAAMRASSGEAI